MNQALFPSSFTIPINAPILRLPIDLPRRERRVARRRTSRASLWEHHEETSRLRRLRSLLALFALYASSLMLIVLVSEGADIGCILGGIAGHVLFATWRIFGTWRDAAHLQEAKSRIAMRFGV